jgi:hypothetical protein
MFALVLQVLGLVGLPVGGFIVGGAGGGVVGLSVSAVYVGLALEADR